MNWKPMRFAYVLAMVVAWPLLTAGSCATTSEPEIRTVTAKVTVVSPCVTKDKDPGTPPEYADADLKSAPDPAARYQRIAGANEQRKARLAVVEPILAACR